MFTGIIQGMGKVEHVDEHDGLRTLTIALPEAATGSIQHGASIAVDGVCLTVVSTEGSQVVFDVMEETLRKTTIGDLKEGDMPNVERSARVGDEIGGHLMSGHVSTTATIASLEKREQNQDVTFQVDPSWMKYILSKGFIGLDGASLTIVDANKEEGTFHVWFIPETLRLTRFGKKQVGDKVNVEIDSQTQSIVETVERVLASQT